ncbi:MAG: zinc-ribbon domain containing protein [Candidatus Kerfeldbacteria bacterium]|nr:zinc-ribbon domain containing protein [Candidatus Kerfeldbacteria bacterium]
MTKTCRQCQNSFIITTSDQDFYKRMEVPAPTLCPNCRQQRRLAWRNERSLYSSTCRLCGKAVISLYSPDKPYTIYCQDCWLSDQWDPLNYALVYDPRRSFFEQFKELQLVVPRMAITIRNCDNSDFAPWAMDGKNLYLSAGGFRNENCLYGMFPTYSKDCMDFIMPYMCELCYEIIECSDCYHCLFSQRCASCRDCYFSYNCRGCNDCFGCVNLRNKQYCWFNEQLTEAEYRQRLQAIQWTHATIANYRAQLAKLKLTRPHVASEQIHCEASTGDLMKGCHDTQYGFDVYDQEQTAYMFDVRETKDSRDIFTGGFQCESVYECHSVLHTQNGVGLNVCWDGNYNLSYCDHCFTSHDLIGCIGLRKQQFCILNTQYSETEYQTLKKHMIADMIKTGEWGEFYPISLSPFAYNETVAQEYFPLTEAEVKTNGWPWHAPDLADYQPAQGDLLACQKCQKNYRLVPAEQKYYKQFGVPLPIFCPQCRHLARMQLRNPRQLWQRQCAKCGKAVATTYAPNRPETIYCELCFQKEVY